MPGKWWSEAYIAAPLTLSGPSTRGNDPPMVEGTVVAMVAIAAPSQRSYAALVASVSKLSNLPFTRNLTGMVSAIVASSMSELLFPGKVFAEDIRGYVVAAATPPAPNCNRQERRLARPGKCERRYKRIVPMRRRHAVGTALARVIADLTSAAECVRAEKSDPTRCLSLPVNQDRKSTR